MKKETKKNSKTYSSDHVEVILENLKEKFELFGEQQQFLVIGQKELKQGQQEICSRLDTLEIKFDGLESKFDNMQEDITEIKHKLSEKVDREEFNKLEKRFIKVERLVLAKKFA
jgi:hypothetical protein